MMKLIFRDFVKNKNIQKQENLGFSQAINIEVKEAACNILVFLNNDVFVTKGETHLKSGR